MENQDKPTYPTIHQNSDGTLDYSLNQGLTKREYFAGLAMQGLLATSRNLSTDSKWLSEAAIRFADELLNQLNP